MATAVKPGNGEMIPQGVLVPSSTGCELGARDAGMRIASQWGSQQPRQPRKGTGQGVATAIRVGSQIGVARKGDAVRNRHQGQRLATPGNGPREALASGALTGADTGRRKADGGDRRVAPECCRQLVYAE